MLENGVGEIIIALVKLSRRAFYFNLSSNEADAREIRAEFSARDHFLIAYAV